MTSETVPVKEGEGATGQGSYRLRGLVILTVGAAVVAGGLFGLVAGAAAVWDAVTGPSTASAPAAGARPSHGTPLPERTRGAKAPAVLRVHLVVDPPPLYGVKAPGGQVHDAFVPGSFTMTVGKVYEVTVLNYDSMPHTWTAPGLGVNAVVPAGSRSKPSVTDFTVHPTKAGTYQWFCATPCDAWSMVHNGYMRGYVKVVA